MTVAIIEAFRLTIGCMMKQLARAAPLAAIAAATVAFAGMASPLSARAQIATATLEKPGDVAITAPSPRTADTLVVGVRSFTPPREGTVSAVVSLVDSTGREQEVGRFAIAARFVAKGLLDERRCAPSHRTAGSP